MVYNSKLIDDERERGREREGEKERECVGVFVKEEEHREDKRMWKKG